MSQETKFTIPPKLGGGDVVMKRLLVGDLEDILAREMAGSKEVGAAMFMKSQTASVCAAIVSFRGVAWPKGIEAEKLWRGLTPQVKNLLIKGYQALHDLADEDEADFLATMAPV